MGTLIQELCAETGMGLLDLRRTLVRAPDRYKVYSIPKRNGGSRVIAQPAREVKLLQRALIKILLDKLPVHHAATAYRSGRSILDNAVAHVKSGPILKLDLKEFFPSIRAIDWALYCRRTKCIEDEEDILLTSHLLFRREPGYRGLRLAIGAPSSPMLSNVLMYDFDQRVISVVEKDKVIYTRYADDMTFSAPRTGHLTGVISSVAKIIRNLKSPNLSINDSKTTHVTQKFRRTVTGLTLSNDCRVTIGRERKRLVSAMLHREMLGRLNVGEQQILAGVLAYINSVEPPFLEWLKGKYGAELVLRIQRSVFMGRKQPAHRTPLAPSRPFRDGDHLQGVAT